MERFTTADNIRIYRIPAQVLPHLSGYVHLILGGMSAPLLIDAGSGELHSTDEILAGFEQVRSEFGETFRPEDLGMILITHAHIDHFGGAGELARITGAKIASHRYDSRVIEAYNETASVSRRQYETFLRFLGTPEEQIDPIIEAYGFVPGRFRSVSLDQFIEDGEKIGSLTAHHFPGHSAGHLIFELGDYFIGGDLVLSKTLTQIWPERLLLQTGLIRYLESLEKLRLIAEERKKANRPLILLPGHEEPVWDVPRRLELVFAGEARREKRLLEIIRRAPEPITAYDLSKRLYLTTYISRTFFALCDAAARLEYLLLQGKLKIANYESMAGRQEEAPRYVARD